MIWTMNPCFDWYKPSVALKQREHQHQQPPPRGRTFGTHGTEGRDMEGWKKCRFRYFFLLMKMAYCLGMSNEFQTINPSLR